MLLSRDAAEEQDFCNASHRVCHCYNVCSYLFVITSAFCFYFMQGLVLLSRDAAEEQEVWRQVLAERDASIHTGGYIVRICVFIW